MSDELRQTIPEVLGDTGDALAQTLADVVRGGWTGSPVETVELKDLEDLTVLAELGRGGMGVVYRAVQRSLDREVAVKLLSPRNKWTDVQYERFHTEVLLAASLNHPNIAHIHWVRRDADLFYFVMEFISGPSLAELLGRKPLSSRELIHIFLQVCDGLEHAHTRGIVHRDLKPGNILVETGPSPAPAEQPEKATSGGKPARDRRGAGDVPLGRAVLVDFGLAARPGEASLTAEGMLMGTPAYMSPEQARGEPTDHLSDVYSLGITLFEVLTGRVPFSAPTPMAMALKHLSDAPPDPRDLVPSVSPTLAELANRMLAKEPERRPESVKEVRSTLERVLAEKSAKYLPVTPHTMSGLANREVTVLTVELDGFTASAYDQPLARTAFLLEAWLDLVDDAVVASGGLVAKRKASRMTAVFNYPEKQKDHPGRAVDALRRLSASMRVFNQTHGRQVTFTAGLESGKVFVGGLGARDNLTCFGQPVDTSIRLCGVRHCGLGIVGSALTRTLGEAVPLEPLIGVAEDLGTASRIAPRFFE